MTPQERQLVDELFDRLASLENAPRDPEAEQAIREGLRRAPHAPYALVQTVLVQDEALKRAEARLRELESAPGDAPAGFLDSMREAFLGRRETPGGGAPPRAGSVPTVRPSVWGPPGPAPGAQGMAPGMAPGYGNAPGYGAAPGYGPAPGYGGGSFLGTAAAAAAGMIGGSLLLNGIRSVTGHQPGAQAGFDPSSAGSAGSAASPWENTGHGDLGRQAGLDDIGGGTGGGGDGRGHGLFDNPEDNGSQQDAGLFDEDFGGDGGFDGGSDGGDSA